MIESRKEQIRVGKSWRREVVAIVTRMVRCKGQKNGAYYFFIYFYLELPQRKENKYEKPIKY